LETPALVGLWALPALPVTLEMTEDRELVVLPGIREQLVTRAQREIPAPQDRQDPRVRQALLALPERLACLALPVRRERPESVDIPDFRVQWGLLEVREA